MSQGLCGLIGLRRGLRRGRANHDRSERFDDEVRGQAQPEVAGQDKQPGRRDGQRGTARGGGPIRLHPERGPAERVERPFDPGERDAEPCAPVERVGLQPRPARRPIPGGQRGGQRQEPARGRRPVECPVPLFEDGSRGSRQGRRSNGPPAARPAPREASADRAAIRTAARERPSRRRTKPVGERRGPVDLRQAERIRRHDAPAQRQERHEQVEKAERKPTAGGQRPASESRGPSPCAGRKARQG